MLSARKCLRIVPIRARFAPYAYLGLKPRLKIGLSSRNHVIQIASKPHLLPKVTFELSPSSRRYDLISGMGSDPEVLGHGKWSAVDSKHKVAALQPAVRGKSREAGSRWRGRR